MIRSITRPKTEEEIDRLLNGYNRVFIVGCGTCVTMTGTGGETEVTRMHRTLKDKGKLVTGQAILPVACDNLTGEALKEYGDPMDQAELLLIMTCAFGVQTVAGYTAKRVVPALDTLFLGKQVAEGLFLEICSQCGTCIIGETGGICPVTSCHKGLLNGPCGGTNSGKCEIDSDKDCAWTLIFKRLENLNRLDLMRVLQKPRNYQAEPGPGRWKS